MEKCKICGAEITKTTGFFAQGRQISPREIAQRGTPRPLTEQEKQKIDVTAFASLYGVSVGIVQFNNPPEMVDKPMWWMCKSCQKIVLK